ncbi:ATP synthase I chain [Geoalkalibacter ferrihydriticus]|uniref:ATP synthase I chain n=1 Tax=Geoalkalibacter ferrihydriticus TaxID=392333 RepID=A0A1G9M980_9BACT|nr:ATP synthase subunit I [Geoalkalibacter ferrihydriticus]SDL70798.1 ATP synthase I chain [Geoalkalibacter ferrihydriticus]
MSDSDREFLSRLAQRNWIILLGLVALSLLWRSAMLTSGILAGGVLALAGFWWLHRGLQQILAQPSPQTARAFQVRYFLRMGALGIILYFLIARLGVHPVGLALGLSVVVINIFCTAIVRFVRHR